MRLEHPRPQTDRPEALLLRVGILRGGRLAGEHLLRPGQALRVGTDPTCTLVLAAPGAPRDHTLVRWTDGRPVLVLPPGGRARLASPAGPREVDPSQPTALGLGARAKVALGEAQVLLQPVPAPPRAARSAGRQRFRPRLLDADDPLFLGFLSTSAAAVLGLSLWAAGQQVPDEPQVPDLKEFFAHISLPTPAPTDPTPPPPPPAPAPEAPVQGTPVARDAPAPLPEPGSLAAAQDRARRVAELHHSATIFRSLATDTSGVFSEDDRNHRLILEATAGVSATGPVDEVVAQFRAVDSPDGFRDRGVEVGRSAGGRQDARIGGPAHGDAPRQVQVVVVPAPPDLPGDAPDELKQVLAGNRRQVQRCYVQRLNEVPTLAGRIVLELDVSGGRVLAARLSEDGVGDDGLAECVTRRARSWRLPAETEGTLSLPFALSTG